MKVSIEHLYHFSCDLCQRWWAIADYKWGSQSTMFCPHCGHTNTLPGKPLTGDDFMAAKASRRGADMPRPGEIYRQHDPAVDQWHEYEVIAIVEPGDRSMRGMHTFRWDLKFTNTEQDRQHQLIHLGSKICAIPAVEARAVAYVSNHPDAPRRQAWLRPLAMFMDGGFTRVF